MILTTQIRKIRGINESDIIESFLKKEHVEQAEDYIRQICHSSTAFLPVYYYMELASLDSPSAVELIRNLNTRNRSKSKLIERISQQKREFVALKSAALGSVKEKLNYQAMFLKGTVPEDLEGKDLKYCIQSIKSLTDNEISQHNEYIRHKALAVYRKYYASADQQLADDFRRAFCRIDEALYAAK